MKTEEISSLTVGTLVKYILKGSPHPADMGLLSEIIEAGELRVYRFIWSSNPAKPTSETPGSLSQHAFSLVQVAE